MPPARGSGVFTIKCSGPTGWELRFWPQAYTLTGSNHTARACIRCKCQDPQACSVTPNSPATGRAVRRQRPRLLPATRTGLISGTLGVLAGHRFRLVFRFGTHPMKAAALAAHGQHRAFR